MVLQPIQARHDPAGAPLTIAHTMSCFFRVSVVHAEQLDRREAERLALAAGSSRLTLG